MDQQQTPPTPEPSDPAPGAPGAPPDRGAEPAAGELTSDDRNLAMLAHLLGIFTWFIGALIIWLIKKDSSPFVDDQGKEALNFQITITIAWVIVSVVTFVTFGFGCLLAPAVWIFDIVFCILAAVAASRGERYRYPLTIRLIT